MALLEKINAPADLRQRSIAELNQLAAEIRELIVDTVAGNGGHLSASLGAVELTLALHFVFDTPRDAVIWDVGHQAYAHKIITGRRDFFKSLRRTGGCSGFLSRTESPDYDVFGGGHAGTAISAALGLAVAAARQGKPGRMVAVVGDGSLSCGISLEGLNSIGDSGVAPVIILNDNRMSISSNVGAITSYLNRIISGRAYSRFRALAKTMLKRVPDVYRSVQRIEEATKSIFLPGGLFEELGIRYLGPINGHSLPDMIRSFTAARDSNRPVLVHVITDKGCGYAPAAAEADRYHGVPPFDRTRGLPATTKTSYSGAFGAAMVELAGKYPELMAITAAMASGTGLTRFAEKFPDRFFDVGIAEEHAVVFAGGLAAGNCHPVVAIYSTFMQRSFDPIFHDVCLQNLPVILAMDRAGILEDGPTHHGIYDLGFLRAMPNLVIMTPADENELRHMLHQAVLRKAPVAIRYPRGGSGRKIVDLPLADEVEKPEAQVWREGTDLAIWAHGRSCFDALKTAELLAAEYRFEAAVVNARYLKPLDAGLARRQAASMPLFSLEDHAVIGGLGSALEEALDGSGRLAGRFGWPDEIIPHGNPDDLLRRYGLDPAAVAKKIAAIVGAGR